MPDERGMESAKEPRIQGPAGEVALDDLSLPLALRRQRRPKKPRDILDL